MGALTNGDILRAHADAQGIPLTSIWKVQEGLKRAPTWADKEALARLLLRHGGFESPGARGAPQHGGLK